MELLLLFIIGVSLCFGSFLTVVIDRLPRGESIVWGSSHCEHCRHKLHVFDLVPVFSYLFLKGRCRYCHKKLSYYYPTIEITTAALFTFTFLSYQKDLFELLFMLFVVTVLIIIFFTDMKYGIIPFVIVVPSSVVVLVYTALFHPGFILSSVLSALGLFLFFFALYRYTHGRGMGFGDVMYVILMGLLLGFPRSILGLYIAFLTGALVAVLLILIKRKQFSGGTIAFGPFLVLGTCIGLFWGDMLVQKIIQLLFPL